MARLSDILEHIEPVKQVSAKKLLTELNFMGRELARLRKDIDTNGSTELFDNGKQAFMRTTPAFQNYVALSGKYSTYHRQLVALLPKATQELVDELDAFLNDEG